MPGRPPNPLTPPELPPVRRLTRLAGLAAALLLCVTAFVVLFLMVPRREVRQVLPAPPRPTAQPPGFLEHPPGGSSLPAARLPDSIQAAEHDLLRDLAERQALQAREAQEALQAQAAAQGLHAQETQGDFQARDARAAQATFETQELLPQTFSNGPPGALPAAPPSHPTALRDPWHEAFLRALQAPLTRSPSPPPAAADPEAAALARLLLQGAPSAASSPGAPASGPSAFAGSAPALRPDLTALGPSGGLASVSAPGLPGVAPAGTSSFSVSPASAVETPPGGPLRPAGRPGDRASTTASSLSLAAAGASASTSPFHPAPEPHTVPAGTLIPAVLLTAVTSDLPGFLIAQITRDIYDRRQQAVLIPKGSRLLGRYDHQVAAGQHRLLAAWHRLQLPDGSSLDLPGLPATDSAGAAGVPAHTDNHLAHVFGSSLLLSVLSAGAQLSQPQPPTGLGLPSAGSVAAGALGQQLSGTGLEILRRGLDIPPTLELPAGTPLTVFVTADLDLVRLPPPAPPRPQAPLNPDTLRAPEAPGTPETPETPEDTAP